MNRLAYLNRIIANIRTHKFFSPCAINQCRFSRQFLSVDIITERLVRLRLHHHCSKWHKNRLLLTSLTHPMQLGRTLYQLQLLILILKQNMRKNCHKRLHHFSWNRNLNLLKKKMITLTVNSQLRSSKRDNKHKSIMLKLN